MQGKDPDSECPTYDVHLLHNRRKSFQLRSHKSLKTIDTAWQVHAQINVAFACRIQEFEKRTFIDCAMYISDTDRVVLPGIDG